MFGVKSRSAVIGGAGLLLALFFLYAFWPRPMRVDIGTVARGRLMVTVDEEAKTRVRDAYMVSAPAAGRLLRVDVEPGDTVIGGETVLAQIMPSTPTILDARSEEQASAAVNAAEAALTLARAEVKKAAAEADFAKAEVSRARTLREENVVAEAALDRAVRAYRAANAALETADAAVAMREADLENARALLMSFHDAENSAFMSNPQPAASIPIRAPISGRVLRVMEESERTIPAGAPILEVGDPLGDLEIVAELLSSDAVKVTPGDSAIIEKWGGDSDLMGVVDRIEPWGFTKFSALGVEEQRVNTIITFADEPEARARLGPGFRVEARIVIWERPDALKIPSNALFRIGSEWGVFKVVGGRARTTKVETGRTNGVETEIAGGLEENDRVVLYPGARVSDGALVAQRAVE